MTARRRCPPPWASTFPAAMGGPPHVRRFVVAVVDEGILSLTRFKSPDPLKELFAKRALGVETYETIGWTLLVPPGGNSRSTGGDEGGAGGAGCQASPARRYTIEP